MANENSALALSLLALGKKGGGTEYTEGEGIAINSDNEISALIDGETIQFNEDGELIAVGGSSEGAVRYDEAQTLTEAQKMQARANQGLPYRAWSAPATVGTNIRATYYATPIFSFSCFNTLKSILSTGDKIILTLHIDGVDSVEEFELSGKFGLSSNRFYFKENANYKDTSYGCWNTSDTWYFYPKTAFPTTPTSFTVDVSYQTASYNKLENKYIDSLMFDSLGSNTKLIFDTKYNDVNSDAKYIICTGTNNTFNNVSSYSAVLGSYINMYGSYNLSSGASNNVISSYSFTSGANLYNTNNHGVVTGKYNAIATNYKGEWSSSTTYDIGDTVYYAGNKKAYKSLVANNKNHYPGNTTNEYWEIINDLYAFIIGNGTSNTNRSNALTVDWNGNLVCNNIPAPPSADGNYVLKCSIVDGTPSYSWVAE